MTWDIIAFLCFILGYIVISGIIIHQGIELREEEGPNAASWVEIIFFAGLWLPILIFGFGLKTYYWCECRWNLFKNHRSRSSRL